ncbi:MAG: trypsin-like peptidase domain-containing protein [Nocardioides sp.]|uniref:trypsin-like serine peptidase n=1 Tax=Nocardioides sp. TaxID=35761 RepID=UPI0039E2D01B
MARSRWSIMLVSGAAALAALTALAAGAPVARADTGSDDAGAPTGTPSATSFGGDPTVGPIFKDGLDDDHSCTASVISSRSGDLILTAAHCVQGDVSGWQFAPGYRDGETPYGVWTVTAAYVDRAWIEDQDPQHDYAILTVADRTDGTGKVDRTGARHGHSARHSDRHRHATRLQDVTGANVLGLAPRDGTTITDIAYNYGIDDLPVTCTTTTYTTDGYPTFDCSGYVGGSSGSPWLTTVRHGRANGHGRQVRVVTGVIGGLHQGGCVDYTSYSSSFTRDVHRLLARADAHEPGDLAPEPGSDGC